MPFVVVQRITTAYCLSNNQQLNNDSAICFYFYFDSENVMIMQKFKSEEKNFSKTPKKKLK